MTYSCPVCSKTFQKRSGLSQHQRQRNFCGLQMKTNVQQLLLKRFDSMQHSTNDGEGSSGRNKMDSDEEMAEGGTEQISTRPQDNAENMYTDNDVHAMTSEPRIEPDSPGLLDIRPSGLPHRKTRRPTRYRDFVDELPPLPPPIIPDTSDNSAIFPSQEDAYTTLPNDFSVFHIFNHGPPSYVPTELSHSIENLSDSPNLLLTSDNTSQWWTSFGSSLQHLEGKWFAPFLTASAFRLMKWFYGASNFKSIIELDKLVTEVLLAEDFKVDDLHTFRTTTENHRLDEWEDERNTPLSPVDGWQQSNVDIPLGAEKFQYKNTSHVPHYPVPGLFYRRPLDVIKTALAEPAAQQFHLIPYRSFWKPSPDRPPERIYSEIFSSDSFLQEYEKVYLSPRENGCQLETVIISLMFWSDSTHLTSFGDASLWPIYMFFGNLSKYIRGKPSTFSAHHLAYIPKLGDHFQDFYYNQFGKAISSSMLTNCRRELVHAVWHLLLDDEFVHAYKHGFTFEFADGKTRRVFPRISTYGMDYPEKVLITLIRYFGNYPCPRCLVPKSEIHRLGTVQDNDLRHQYCRLDDKKYRSTIKKAWNLVYLKGKGVTSRDVDNMLTPQSLVPVRNAFSERLSEFGFNFYDMAAPDLLHEFELGVWKRTFTHLLRILIASGGDSIQILNERYRSTPTFGNGVIQRFRTNPSAMKKLAGRDYEDLLQCALPAFEGLLPAPHDSIICELIFELCTWHSLAKLRLHTESTVVGLEGSTRRLGRLFRRFLRTTCASYETRELSAETAVRGRRLAALSQKQGQSGRTMQSLNSKKVVFQLNTYKYHSLGDYASYIRKYGTTDNYSTQLGEVEHKRVKKFYPRTHKRQYTQGIAYQQKRERLLHLISQRDPYLPRPENILGKQQQEQEYLPPLSPSEHCQMSTETGAKINIVKWLYDNSDDPALKGFLVNLRKHLFMQIIGYNDGRDEDEITEAEANTIHILNDLIYEHQRLRINYTTYDLRRAQDTISPKSHPDIMTLSPEYEDENEKFHPYWYARVIKIFHAQVYFRGCKTCPHIPPGQRTMKFLFVRWFGIEKEHKYGWVSKHLPMVGFSDPDSEPFGFINPYHILRASHIIPAFAFGRTSHLLSKSMARKSSEGDEDHLCYYVNIFVDRDMMMRYRGGGIGHKSSRNATNVFLDDRDPLDYPADQPNPLASTYDDIEQPSATAGELGFDDAALELSDDEEELQLEHELNENLEVEDELHEVEDQYDLDDVDGRLTTEEELGFAPL